MDRPKGDDPNLKYTSPIVYGYKLKLTTGGETIEYQCYTKKTQNQRIYTAAFTERY